MLSKSAKWFRWEVAKYKELKGAGSYFPEASVLNSVSELPFFMASIFYCVTFKKQSSTIW